MFQSVNDTNYPVIPAPSMRRRSSSDLEELGMEIRKLEEEVGDMDLNVKVGKQRRAERVDDVNLNVAQQTQTQRRTERVVETRKSKVTKRTASMSKR